MRGRLARFVVLIMLISLLGGCPRSGPPEVRKFRPPARTVIVDSAPAELASDVSPTPVVEVKREPEPEKPAASAPAPKPVQEAKPAPKPAEAKAPSIVGTWKITEMSRGGTPMPMPAEMQMTWTFSEDGTFSMSMTAGGQSHNQEGTYTLADGQITITMKGDSKSGSCTVTATELTLDIDGSTIKATRS